MRNYKPGPGRRSKGARKAFMTRLPDDLAAIIEEEATSRDISYSEYLALIAARAHGFEVTIPARIVPGTTQSVIDEIDELALGQTA